MKYFISSAQIQHGSRGVSDYQLTKDSVKMPICIMRGTFSAVELRLLADALEKGNQDFELPETIKQDKKW